jgi:uncharacterized protein YbcI
MDSSHLVEGLPSRLSNAAAGVLAKRLGPGPTRVRAVVDRQAILILFSDGLTKGERMQMKQGNAHYVQAARQEFQRLMRDDLIDMVEDVSSRNVMVFLAHTQLDPDVGITVFLLEPDSPRRSPGASPDGTYPLDPRARRHLRAVPPKGA